MSASEFAYLEAGMCCPFSHLIHCCLDVPASIAARSIVHRRRNLASLTALPICSFGDV